MMIYRLKCKLMTFSQIKKLNLNQIKQNEKNTKMYLISFTLLSKVKKNDHVRLKLRIKYFIYL